MKRFLIPLLCLLFAAAVPMSAASLPEVHEKDFSVNYSEGWTFIPVTDGTATGEMPDGTKVKAEGLPDNVTNLRVFPVEKTEPEARAWLAEAVGDEWNLQDVYYVVCTDKTGETVPHAGAKITIEVDDAEDHTLFAITKDGTATEIPFEVSKDGITFTATNAPYYAFCTVAKNPSTNDMELLALTLLGAELAILSIVVLLAIRRRNEPEEE